MKSISWMTAVTLALVIPGCSKKNETETVPPGFCATSSECQATADRQQARLQELRDQLKAQGVHDEYLPCGTYQATKAANGYWTVTQDNSGCPATASQQDPHPNPSKVK